jgi:hypothetical protein
MDPSITPEGGNMPERKLLDRIMKMRRDRADDASAAAPRTVEDGRLERLEARVAHLESALEGLQDAVHRESVRHDGRIAELQRKMDPHSIAQALSADARRRGI